MLKEVVTKEEIKKIVNSELKKVVKDELKKELAASLKHGAGKEEIQLAIKNALNNLYKFMWIKRHQWNNEIR
jgi:flagellar basal body-associated protein FliL